MQITKIHFVDLGVFLDKSLRREATNLFFNGPRRREAARHR
jgi:hypothetical protein